MSEPRKCAACGHPPHEAFYDLGVSDAGEPIRCFLYVPEERRKGERRAIRGASGNGPLHWNDGPPFDRRVSSDRRSSAVPGAPTRPSEAWLRRMAEAEDAVGGNVTAISPELLAAVEGCAPAEGTLVERLAAAAELSFGTELSFRTHECEGQSDSLARFFLRAIADDPNCPPEFAAYLRKGDTERR